MGVTRVKICGITNVEDALLSISLGADALGFIFCDSPRQITIKNAETIIKKLPPFVSKVAVVKDFSEGEIWALLSHLPIDTIQFHGSESEEYCLEFLPHTIIKTISIKSEKDINKLKVYPSQFNFLLDTYSEIGGGSGKTFNWDIALKAKQYGNIIIAGGLNPNNINSAINLVNPYGIDISSGLEKSPGKKDHDKMKYFFEVIKKRSIVQ